MMKKCCQKGGYMGTFFAKIVVGFWGNHNIVVYSLLKSNNTIIIIVIPFSQ